MNRSCNSILCRFGIHTADPYVHIQVKCRNGSHRWQSNYEVCKRCGKRLRKNPYCEGASVMKWKRIKCFLTGGHRLYDKNLQTIHDTNGYHFINYCVKCGKVFAAFMAEAELNGLIDRDIEQFRKERQHGRL